MGGATFTNSELAKLGLSISERAELAALSDQPWCGVCKRPTAACVNHKKLRLGDRDIVTPSLSEKVKAVRNDASLRPFVGKLVCRLADDHRW